MATLYTPHQGTEQYTTTTVTPKNGKKFTLAEAQALVGGYVEMIDINNGFLLVDEDGRMKCLPVNHAVSIFGKTIVGPVLHCRKGEF